MREENNLHIKEDQISTVETIQIANPTSTELLYLKEIVLYHFPKFLKVHKT